MINIVGLSAGYHDSASCLLQENRLIAAAQEERFSRRKHDKGLPLHSFLWCLKEAQVTIAGVDCVAYYEDPFKKLERQIVQFGPMLSPQGCMRLWQRAWRPLHAIREILGYEGEIDIVDHHQSHAASAFFFSGFSEAAVLTVDGVGETATTTYGHGSDDGLTIFEEVPFPHSLGLLYSTITAYLGFSVNDGEYKVMGLAPHGNPRYVSQMHRLVESGASGQYRLNDAYFDFTRGDAMYSDAMQMLFGTSPRVPGSALLAVHADIARSLQVVLEELLLDKVQYLHDRVPVDDLCMAGGVALNCVANGRILRERPFRRLFVQPAAGDAGGALGAAAVAYTRRRTAPRLAPMRHAFIGPGYTADAIGRLLKGLELPHIDYRGDEPALLDAAVKFIAAGKTVAWFQGRMEFGPRALGARSILADPRDADMRDRINSLIKERERFRPFAPVVLESMSAQHFALDHPTPFMLETCQVTSPLALPAITHVDGSARVQTVDRATQPRFAALLELFYRRTGCPVLLNTSFNLRDEPIVASPTDALVTFARSRLDALVIEDFVIEHRNLSAEIVERCQEFFPQIEVASSVYTF